MMINEENRKSFKEMMKGRAVYIALSVCVLAAGAVSYASIKTPVPKTDVTTTLRSETSAHTHVNERVLPEEPTAAPEPVSERTELVLPSEAPAEAVFDNAAEPLETTTAAAKQIVYSLPCGAKLGADYSMGVPVFSATMGDYRTHNGADFPGEAGAAVTAVAAGTVTSVSADPLYGNTVTVTHAGGVVSAVSGLADEGLIEVGAKVTGETVIGLVGRLPAEEKEGSHIHLEIRRDGALVDPVEVLGIQGEEE